MWVLLNSWVISRFLPDEAIKTHLCTSFWSQRTAWFIIRECDAVINFTFIRVTGCAIMNLDTYIRIKEIVGWLKYGMLVIQYSLQLTLHFFPLLVVTEKDGKIKHGNLLFVAAIIPGQIWGASTLIVILSPFHIGPHFTWDHLKWWESHQLKYKFDRSSSLLTANGESTPYDQLLPITVTKTICSSSHKERLGLRNTVAIFFCFFIFNFSVMSTGSWVDCIF